MFSFGFPGDFFPSRLGNFKSLPKQAKEWLVLMHRQSSHHASQEQCRAHNQKESRSWPFYNTHTQCRSLPLLGGFLVPWQLSFSEDASAPSSAGQVRDKELSSRGSREDAFGVSTRRSELRAVESKSTDPKHPFSRYVSRALYAPSTQSPAASSKHFWLQEAPSQFRYHSLKSAAPFSGTQQSLMYGVMDM